jgi:hypothetical protein
MCFPWTTTFPCSSSTIGTAITNVNDFA